MKGRKEEEKEKEKKKRRRRRRRRDRVREEDVSRIRLVLVNRKNTKEDLFNGLENKEKYLYSLVIIF